MCRRHTSESSLTVPWAPFATSYENRLLGLCSNRLSKIQGNGLAAANSAVTMARSPQGHISVDTVRASRVCNQILAPWHRAHLDKARFDDQFDCLVGVLETALIEDRRIEFTEWRQIVAAFNSWGERILR